MLEGKLSCSGEGGAERDVKQQRGNLRNSQVGGSRQLGLGAARGGLGSFHTLHLPRLPVTLRKAECSGWIRTASCFQRWARLAWLMRTVEADSGLRLHGQHEEPGFGFGPSTSCCRLYT